MNIIKEKCVHQEYKTIRIIIRTNCYSSMFSHFVMLKAELDKDFPDAEIDPEIKQYGGRRYKRTFGIEFTLSAGSSVPRVYKKIREVEYIL